MSEYKYSISNVYSAQVKQEEEQHVYMSNTTDQQPELDLGHTSTSYTYTSDGTGDNWNNGTIWVTDHTITYPNTPVQQPLTTDTVYIPSVWTVPGENEDVYPKLPNALGVIYVEEGVIKCRTPEGKDIVLGNMEDGEDEVSINIIATIAKRLLEKPSEETA